MTDTSTRPVELSEHHRNEALREGREAGLRKAISLAITETGPTNNINAFKLITKIQAQIDNPPLVVQRNPTELQQLRASGRCGAETQYRGETIYCTSKRPHHGLRHRCEVPDGDGIIVRLWEN